ncbi:hypothetical protein B0J14DRAFT_664407 [Halenospora varia]|nr:hypothetical protein B0J14DRAFT_664407 [Halenospora varia]
MRSRKSPIQRLCLHRLAFQQQSHNTLYTQADVDAVTDCKVFNGSILVDFTFQGNVFLPNLESLGGSITANANLTLSYGSEVGIGVGVGIAVLACITTIVYLVKKNYLSKDNPEKSPAGDGSEVSELPQGKHYEKAEVCGERGVTLELPLGRHHETGRCLLSMRRENCMENDSGQCTADHTPETCGEN